MAIPVVDIFAGPGGLGEGFSALSGEKGQQEFRIVLSIEKDNEAHKTLTLRSFFRQFPPGEVPEDYYLFVRGEITLDQLYERNSEMAELARKEAWKAELGVIPDSEVDKRIARALDGERNWLLIGGPPCQAYSIVGRSRRKEKVLDAAKDHRVELYKQYLRILAVHSPAVFVMENVKGILSAKTEASPIFARILKDLSNPAEAFAEENYVRETHNRCPGYKIFSLVKQPNGLELDGTPIYRHQDFIIEAEKYGIPQTRHRVILLGIRNDADIDTDLIPRVLLESEPVALGKVIGDLPALRSSLSRLKDTLNWVSAIKAINLMPSELPQSTAVFNEIQQELEAIRTSELDIGGNYIPCQSLNKTYGKGWFFDPRLNGVANHASRGHMNKDLHRYFYASCFARIYKKSPKIRDFPERLHPSHSNVDQAVQDNKFGDRFRVQLPDHPAKTITSHIAKDGHYYIHPDPKQCRTLTVREAARIQTFPDNYFFCGSRTAQYHQVGNAVPPYLAFQIAEIVKDIFKSYRQHQKQAEIQSQVLVG